MFFTGNDNEQVEIIMKSSEKSYRKKKGGEENALLSEPEMPLFKYWEWVIFHFALSFREALLQTSLELDDAIW